MLASWKQIKTIFKMLIDVILKEKSVFKHIKDVDP